MIFAHRLVWKLQFLCHVSFKTVILEPQGEKLQDLAGFIVLLPKKYQFKISDSCVDHWDNTHTLGCLGQAVAAGRTPLLRKGLEGCGAATAFGRNAAKRWGRSAEARSPAKPGFLRSKKCAQIMLCRWKHSIDAHQGLK
jgi:hypothetical protein